MKVNLTVRWIVIAVIWTGSLMLTYWNINKISLISNEIEKEEAFKMDDIFWNYNSGNISQILTKRDSLILPVESKRLGLLTVESKLIRLAKKYGFNEIQIENYPEQTGDLGIPIKIYFEGPFKSILPWLSTMENYFPYLPAKHIKITANPVSKRAIFQTWLYLRYKFSDSGNKT
jgi:hypothetical protein